jgi:hypothetical protein
MRNIALFCLSTALLLLAGCTDTLVHLPIVSVNPGVVEEGGSFRLTAIGTANSMIQWFGPDNTVYDSATWSRNFVTRAMGGAYKVVQRVVVYDDTISSDTVTILVTVMPKVADQPVVANDNDIQVIDDAAVSDSSTGDDTAAAADDTGAADDTSAASSDDSPPPPADDRYCTAEPPARFHFNDNGKYKLTILTTELGGASKYTLCLSGGGCSYVGEANTRCFVNGQVGDTRIVKVTGLCQALTMAIQKESPQVNISTDDSYVNGNVLFWQADDGFKLKVKVEKVPD